MPAGRVVIRGVVAVVVPALASLVPASLAACPVAVPLAFAAAPHVVSTSFAVAAATVVLADPDATDPAVAFSTVPDFPVIHAGNVALLPRPTGGCSSCPPPPDPDIHAGSVAPRPRPMPHAAVVLGTISFTFRMASLSTALRASSRCRRSLPQLI